MDMTVFKYKDKAPRYFINNVRVSEDLFKDTETLGRRFDCMLTVKTKTGFKHSKSIHR